MSLKGIVQTTFHRLGCDIRRFELAVPARRQRMFESFGITTIIDVGANVGQYAEEVRKFGYGARIISVEPLSQPFKKLESLATDDPKWETVQAALGAKSGQISVHISEASIFSSVLALTEMTEKAQPNSRQVDEETVPLMTLDSLAPEADSHVAVKIDVQGFERDVLDGAREVLAVASIFEMELSPVPLYEGQMLITEAIQRMHQAGFVLSLTENIFRDVPTGRSLQFNGVFTRRHEV